jgi:hypothetical protein
VKHAPSRAALISFALGLFAALGGTAFCDPKALFAAVRAGDATAVKALIAAKENVSIGQSILAAAITT